MMEPEYTGGGSACCFCFSTNKKSTNIARNYNKSKGSFLSSDMSTFSVKEQERRLKKALEDEEKASKEAERVVQWVKQESAKIDVSTIKRVLSDDDDDEEQGRRV